MHFSTCKGLFMKDTSMHIKLFIIVFFSFTNILACMCLNPSSTLFPRIPVSAFTYFTVLSSLLSHLLFNIYYAILTGFLNLKPLGVYLFFVCNLFISFHALHLLAKSIISHLNFQVQKKRSEQLLKSGHILMVFLVTLLVHVTMLNILSMVTT